MIRLRNNKGVIVKPEVTGVISFVEICDQEGKVGLVICEQDGGNILHLKPGDEAFDRYCRLFKEKPQDKFINLE